MWKTKLSRKYLSRLQIISISKINITSLIKFMWFWILDSHQEGPEFWDSQQPSWRKLMQELSILPFWRNISKYKTNHYNLYSCLTFNVSFNLSFLWSWRKAWFFLMPFFNLVKIITGMSVFKSIWFENIACISYWKHIPMLTQTLKLCVSLSP